MTLLKAPWAIDGPQIPSSLARIGSYISTSGAEGIVSLGDLKVTQLDTPGVGVQISSGAAVVLNRYQNPKPQQSYAIENVNAHVVDSADMPPANAAAKSYLLVITVGDPDFSTVGHPFMGEYTPGTTDPNTFEFVRVRFVECPANTKHFKELGLNYPGYAPARIDIPANTTTIINDYIVDLRKMAQPRTHEDITHIEVTPGDNLGTTLETFPAGGHFDIDEVPEWATYAIVTGFVEGLNLDAAGAGFLRIAWTNGGAPATQGTNINEPAPAGAIDRKDYNLGGKLYVPPQYRGTTQRIRVEGRTTGGATGFLASTDNTTVQIRVLFQEVPD